MCGSELEVNWILSGICGSGLVVPVVVLDHITGWRTMTGHQMKSTERISRHSYISRETKFQSRSYNHDRLHHHHHHQQRMRKYILNFCIARIILLIIKERP